MDKLSTESSLATSPQDACGVVMPISAIDNCDEHHWIEVKEILFDAIRKANLTPDLVSNADDVGVIQARIVKNLYENPIVVCDVSARNANVMFELGLRLAFDKPTVIVIDDKTPFSFDTSPIEHLKYPRDLRHGKIQKFKSDLADKLLAVLRNAKEPGYSTFLKHFGSFTASKLEKKELAPADFVAFVTRKLTELDENITLLRRSDRAPAKVSRKISNEQALAFTEILRKNNYIRQKMMQLEKEITSLQNSKTEDPVLLSELQQTHEHLQAELFITDKQLDSLKVSLGEV